MINQAILELSCVFLVVMLCYVGVLAVTGLLEAIDRINDVIEDEDTQ
jgi:hypothetical protein